jgi:hypothetical protein
MKKITAIMMSIFIISSLKSIAQESKTGNAIKKQQFCSAKITMLDKSVEKYALGGFANDSVIVFPIQMINKHPEIQIGKETRIAATSIKKIAISIEKVRNAPGIYSNDSTIKKGANDIVASAFKKNKGNEVIGDTGGLLSDMVTGGYTGVAVGIFMLPILIPASILLHK